MRFVLSAIAPQRNVQALARGRAIALRDAEVRMRWWVEGTDDDRNVAVGGRVESVMLCKP